MPKRSLKRRRSKRVRNYRRYLKKGGVKENPNQQCIKEGFDYARPRFNLEYEIEDYDCACLTPECRKKNPGY